MTEAEGVLLILDTLSTQMLRDLAASTEVEVSDHRVRAKLQAALADYYRAAADLLADLERPILQDLCDEFELPAGGSAGQLRERLRRFVEETALDDEDDASADSSRVSIIATAPTASPGPWGDRPVELRGQAESSGETRADAVLDAADQGSNRWWTVLGAAAVVMAVGRFVNELDFLYPSRGNVIASARRRNNPLAIAFKGISVIFGGAFLVLFVLLALLSGAVHR